MEKQETYLNELERKQLQLINHYGMENQLNQLIEESAELVQAICKWKRNYKSENCIDSLNNLVEELADVLNLIEQIRLSDAYLEDGINKIKDYKVNRELKRIKQYLVENLKELEDKIEIIS